MKNDLKISNSAKFQNSRYSGSRGPNAEGGRGGDGESDV